MIVSGIWWKRVEGALKLVAVGQLLMLGGCGFDQLLFGPPPASPPPEPQPLARVRPSQVDVAAGLAPLPTPQQVLTAVPFGRHDPFASLPSAAPPGPTPASGSAAAPAGPGSVGARPAAARLAPPQGFRLTGVIRSGGHAEALVSYGLLSGSLRPGDRAGRSTDLLPPGWSLASIQFGGRSAMDRPSVTLKRGSQTVKVSL